MRSRGHRSERRTLCEAPRAPGRPAIGAVAAIVLALTLGLGLPIGSSAANADGIKAMWGPASRNGVSLFPAYRELGVKIYEEDLRWNLIARRRPRHARNPSDPAYVWPAELTRAVGEARHYGMQVALQIIGSPPWANGDKPPKWATFDPRSFANFAIAASRRYPSVHLWMIWGEPSRSHNFRPLTPARPYLPLNARQRIAPHLYSRILDAAYGALKSVSPANLVIGGMTDTASSISPVQWLENMRLPNGKPPRLDLYGHNPFNIRAPLLLNPPSPDEQIDFSDVGLLAELVDHNLGRPENPHPQLFLSEWTIPTAVDLEFNYHVSQRVQAAWIEDAFKLIREDARIYALGWIHLYDNLPQAAGGLIEANGRKKLGYFAWKDG
jgi:hypothetical protein